MLFVTGPAVNATGPSAEWRVVDLGGSGKLATVYADAAAVGNSGLNLDIRYPGQVSAVQKLGVLFVISNFSEASSFWVQFGFGRSGESARNLFDYTVKSASHSSTTTSYTVPVSCLGGGSVWVDLTRNAALATALVGQSPAYVFLEFTVNPYTMTIGVDVTWPRGMARGSTRTDVWATGPTAPSV